MSATATRNLVLVHTPGWQGVGDFEAIKAQVEAMAPDIAVFIVSNAAREPMARKKAAARPSLIFSPLRLMSFRPDRGRIYAGRSMSKLEEMETLVRGGLPVPRFEEIRPETVLSEEVYGPFTVVKPSHALASWGQGIELMRTRDVRYRPPATFPADHPARHAPLIAQRFIDCGHAMTCRVLTLFGAPLFTYVRQSTVPLALDPEAERFGTADFMPVPETSSAAITRDADFLGLAKAAHEAMPDIALQACDILRDKHGGLHILEVNPGGGTWMFSSETAWGYKKRLGIDDLAAPFDAFGTAARVLVDRTRAEAL